MFFGLKYSNIESAYSLWRTPNNERDFPLIMMASSKMRDLDVFMFGL